jgi:hypothetical protein
MHSVSPQTLNLPLVRATKQAYNADAPAYLFVSCSPAFTLTAVTLEQNQLHHIPLIYFQSSELVMISQVLITATSTTRSTTTSCIKLGHNWSADILQLQTQAAAAAAAAASWIFSA